MSVYLHTLGNLTLSAYNAELSNETFSVKRRYYKNSNIQLNKDLYEFKKWDKGSIENRANALIERFLEIWPYFGKPENEMKKVTGSTPRLLTIQQNSYPVKSWRGVMERTLLAIHDINMKDYEKVMKKNPGFLSLDGKGMRSPKKMQNEHYMEANLSSKDIYNFCIKAFEESGNNKGDWHVEIEFK